MAGISQEAINGWTVASMVFIVFLIVIMLFFLVKGLYVPRAHVRHQRRVETLYAHTDDSGERSRRWYDQGEESQGSSELQQPASAHLPNPGLNRIERKESRRAEMRFQPYEIVSDEENGYGGMRRTGNETSNLDRDIEGQNPHGDVNPYEASYPPHGTEGSRRNHGDAFSKPEIETASSEYDTHEQTDQHETPFLGQCYHQDRDTDHPKRKWFSQLD
ncbi:hypothetical protein AJ79_02560 [Helicocarpus griseus UAMH5409]|uniref:Uncharacterized protein n=1 Tax=Helicocarpus griseus UAMH5409 TaxID=1447875 RepID=A0A2B7Y1X6_9EURO|nr:hypothetical protein AJ79_02560 [Helicocarpus griseus UAMH5409]